MTARSHYSDSMVAEKGSPGFQQKMMVAERMRQAVRLSPGRRGTHAMLQSSAIQNRADSEYVSSCCLAPAVSSLCIARVSESKARVVPVAGTPCL